MSGSRGPVVVDASLAIKWLRVEAGSDWARALLVSGRPLVVPGVFAIECGNVLWRLQRRSEAGAPDPAMALSALLAMPIERVDGADAAARAALSLAMRLDHPVYDCLYLALALERGAALATADTRFAAVIARTGVLPPDRLLTPPP